VLDRVVDASGAALSWRPYEMIADVGQWVTALVDVVSDGTPAEMACGGIALVTVGHTYVLPPTRADTASWRSSCSARQATSRRSFPCT